MSTNRRGKWHTYTTSFNSYRWSLIISLTLGKTETLKVYSSILKNVQYITFVLWVGNWNRRQTHNSSSALKDNSVKLLSFSKSAFHHNICEKIAFIVFYHYQRLHDVNVLLLKQWFGFICFMNISTIIHMGICESSWHDSQYLYDFAKRCKYLTSSS